VDSQPFSSKEDQTYIWQNTLEGARKQDRPAKEEDLLRNFSGWYQAGLPHLANKLSPLAVTQVV